MAMDEKTKQMAANKRAANASLIAKLTKDKAEHQAAITAIEAQIKGLNDESAALVKDIPEPTVVAEEL